MSHSEIIESHFNSIENYSYVADKVVPFNRELQEKVLSEISIWAKGDFSLVDLGVGQGDVAKEILAQFPGAHIVGVDMSEKMLARTKKRLSRFGERVRLQKGVEYADFGMEHDFVISQVTIHNSTDDEKMRLFKRIYDSLAEKGIFINADFIAGEDQVENERDRNWYFHFLEQNLRGRELEVWTRHAFYEDNPSKLSDQFAWLKEAGFQKVECTWKKMNLAVYVAYK